VALVYLHRRKDNNDVFYVGISNNENRAFEKKKNRRNTYWYNFIQKHDFYVDFTHKNISWEEACVIEKYLIMFYREYSYSLCNITDGGEGTLGYKVSEDLKLKYKKLYKGKKRTQDVIEKMKKPKKNNTNSLKGTKWSEERKMAHSLNMRGIKRSPVSEETRRKISEKRKGMVFTEKHRENIVKSLKCRVVSDETKKKMRESHLGKKYKIKNDKVI
jgi:hypothetical protein